MIWRPKYSWGWGRNLPGGAQLRVYASWRMCGCGIGVVATTTGQIEITVALAWVYAYLDIPAEWCREESEDGDEW